MTAPTSNISRWVAFLILPLATAAATLISVKAKAWFGVDLDPAQAVVFIISVAGGITTWLLNRGKWEIAKHFGPKTGTDVDRFISLIEERLPPPPSAPAPGSGSPESPRAPGSSVHGRGD